MKNNRLSFLAAVALAAASTFVSAAPRLQVGPDAEITHDGLHRVDKTVFDNAWVKPDLDLRSYDRLMLVGVGFSYKAVDNEGNDVVSTVDARISRSIRSEQSARGDEKYRRSRSSGAA